MSTGFLIFIVNMRRKLSGRTPKDKNENTIGDSQVTVRRLASCFRPDIKER